MGSQTCALPLSVPALIGTVRLLFGGNKLLAYIPGYGVCGFVRVLSVSNQPSEEASDWSGVLCPINPLQPSGHYMYRQFNIQQLYVLPTQCIYVFCVDLRTNSNYFPIQH